ncbi:CTLH/CRA C-terminal to lish motif domain-containing protein [Sporodiniella umbellata]|nr:CTLH/CRA C-terminal to lish motif domain-containing protein [Sporodiniella umbellata]
MDNLKANSRVISHKQKTMYNTIFSQLDSFYELLKTTKETISDENKTFKIEALKEQAKKLSFHKPQKEYQNSLTKMGKEMEKKFRQDVVEVYQPEAFVDKQKVIQSTLAIHFVRQGQFQLCENFLHEAGIPIDSELRDTVEKLKGDIQQMHTILQQIEKENDLTLAIEWAQANREGLGRMQSSLEFSLHRMKYIQMLLFSTRLEAVRYGMDHFKAFCGKRDMEVSRLLTASLYIDKPEVQLYNDLFAQSNWTEIQQEFQKDFCSLLQISMQSPLQTSSYVGIIALPVIMKMYKIMTINKAEWSAQDELPVEVPLDESLRFHSVFACPVSKEQATDENPPMMLTCGHVICKESLKRLAKSSRSSSKFKCPYCPHESTFDQATQVYF